MRLLLTKLSLPLALAVAIAGCNARNNHTGYHESPSETIAGLHVPNPELKLSSSKSNGKPATQADTENTAKITAELLQQDNYLRNPSPDQISTRMFDLYINDLDPLHLFLLQSDIDEFKAQKSAAYSKLVENGDTALANVIYHRYLERFDQQVEQANAELKAGNFTFTGNDTFLLDRKTAAHPKDIEEAKKLWHDRLRFEYLQEKLNKAKPDDIVKTLTRRYARLSREVHDNNSDDVLERYLNALAHAYDPHSDYFGKAALDRFNSEMQLSLVGIGASLQSIDGYCKIMELLPGGPAIRSNKLKVGDRIVGVAQGSADPVDTIDMNIDKVVQMIRGKKNTEVRLTIVPADTTDLSKRKVVTLVRDEIKLDQQEAKAEVIDEPGANGKPVRLGYIDLPSFYEDFYDRSPNHKSATNDVARLLKKLETEKITGLILDLRTNGGGSLDEAIRMTGLFIRRGPVVQVKKPNNQVETLDTDPGIQYTGPMIVLCNRYSASASEILAGALQDYGRAVIVGDPSTFGKGTVQKVENLGEIMDKLGVKTDSDPGALKLTIQKFFRPSGSSTQLKGVLSDIVIPSVTADADYSEQTLDYPLPWDTIPSSKFDTMSMVQPYLAELKKKSGARVTKDPEFVALQQYLAETKKQRDTKTISLNEEQRQKETKDAEARLNALKKVLTASANPNEKIYKLTLKDVNQPGLPPAYDSKKDTPKPDPKANGEDSADPLPTTAKATGPDMILQETERILMDFITLKLPHGTAAR